MHTTEPPQSKLDRLGLAALHVGLGLLTLVLVLLTLPALMLAFGGVQAGAFASAVLGLLALVLDLHRPAVTRQFSCPSLAVLEPLLRESGGYTYDAWPRGIAGTLDPLHHGLPVLRHGLLVDSITGVAV